ncbi:DUF262 domain-containing protein [Commensalibacter communis]|uniref:DUF262 domain-containing protein n=1 Tax=Commensalibacter communis TaxID=2972786 RepID=UPI0022FF9AF3|nr:DUF262 domain-containing protein [Commensalibacter communis]CAI3937264.1 DNAse/DNA nickase specific for phosphorothioated or glycosylated phage DNA [Commensalibacter communis]CAI3940869.1 DNAse/DNA nickase specific for phosphorothioated or glycosylated phage DNA [Commensalibacter communis]
MSQLNNNNKTEEQIEKEIEKEKKEFDFDIREYTLEFLKQQFNPDPKLNKEAEMYIPDYQREFVWTQKQQSLFIESLLIGLPIPYIFGADIGDEENTGDGRVEIIDGAQRIQTIDCFLDGNLELKGMERLPSLENKKYDDLSPARKRRLNRTTIRMIELTNINEDGRRTMFTRLNTGGSKLSDMEKRRGASDTPFIMFVDQLSQNELVKKLIPLPEAKQIRREREEYVLRFFAYLNNYNGFKKSVTEFLDEYIEIANQETPARRQEYENIFLRTLQFVENNFKYGFRRDEKFTVVSRVRFEAIAVGVALAIKSKPSLFNQTNIDTQWALENEFLTMIRSDASNSKPKVIARIEYVKNKLLA